MLGKGALAASLLVSTSIAAFAAPLITGKVSDAVTVAVTGDRSSMLAVARDHGALVASMSIPHVMLALQRPPAMQAKLDALVAAQQDRTSPSYHQWLKPTDLRAYGPDPADIATVEAWLTSHGLKVNSVSPSGMMIDFGGSVSAITAAFHTSLHNVSLPNGEAHIAAMTDAAIPAALAPVVRGAVLSNFFAKPNMVRKAALPADTVGNPAYYAVTPADFDTIYNINPLLTPFNYYGQPITGLGVTVALVEQTDVLPRDWAAFRTAFGLTSYAGVLKPVHAHCTDPGHTPDEGEAALDVEWAGAVAPDATILEVSCAATSPLEFGVATALQTLVEYPTNATVFSISYGGPETGQGLTFEEAWTNLVEEGAAEGKSIEISSGDSGVAGDTDANGIAFTGLAVNGLSTNPYNTTLGGTDFYDTALGHNATYWSSKNGAFFSSAKSYIPEIPWDNSCASSILTAFENKKSPTDAMTLCNTNTEIGQAGVGGTGGQSVYFAKPSWQKALGVPNDGVRDQPDLSLFAANGIWGHFYVFCMSDTAEDGAPCKYNTQAQVFGNAAGGTSFASPIFAGIMALIVQTYGGEPLGVAAPRLYQIASAQFNNSLLLTQCKSTQGYAISTACVFNNVNTGNIAEPCYAGSANCYVNSESTSGIGILSANLKTGSPAFPAGTGYSLATGLGTVNVLNLLYNF